MSVAEDATVASKCANPTCMSMVKRPDIRLISADNLAEREGLAAFQKKKLCVNCYQYYIQKGKFKRPRPEKGPCSNSECPSRDGPTPKKMHWVKGAFWCNTCYQRIYHTGTPRKPERPLRTRCTFQGCKEPTRGNKFRFVKRIGLVLCNPCYQRFHRRGGLQ